MSDGYVYITAPQPPEGRAGPSAYTAMSAATTIAYLPSQEELSAHVNAFINAEVPGRYEYAGTK